MVEDILYWNNSPSCIHQLNYSTKHGRISNGPRPEHVQLVTDPDKLSIHIITNAPKLRLSNTS